MTRVFLMFSAMLFVASSQATPLTQPDNSAVNERDRSNYSVTAGDQSTSERDTHITSEIRKAIVADDSLSTYAHNVKIITINGKVTLKGPVENDREKQAIFNQAVRVAGRKAVTNQIEIVKGE